MTPAPSEGCPQKFKLTRYPYQSVLVAHREEVYSYSFCKGDHDVHTAEFDDCAVDDDYQRGLLGFLGQYV